MWAPIVLTLSTAHSHAQVVLEHGTAEMQRIDVIEHLGDTIPLGLRVTTDEGHTVTLRELFAHDRPVLLTLGYYECPMLCNLVFNGVAEGVRQLDWRPGKDFTVLTVSINPHETPQLAHAKKMNYVATVGGAADSTVWAFCVAAEDQSQALADALGFKFFYDSSRNEYAHPAVVFLLSPEGVISRYLYGIEFRKQDLKLGLLEASEGRIGNTIDRLILYCFHYDPDSRGYVVFAGNVMRLGGAAAVIILGAFLAVMWTGERRRRRLRSSTPDLEPAAKR